MELSDIILSQLNEHKEAFTEHNSYIYPNIPEQKLNNAFKVHNISQNERIFWLADLTLSGSAKDSTIMTDYGIRTIQTVLGVKSQKHIFWSDIDNFYYDQKRGFVFLRKDGVEVVFERMDFNVFSKRDEAQIAGISEALIAIIEFAKLSPNELPQNEQEENFLKDIEYMFTDDYVIDETEHKVLNKLRDKYGISMERSQELISMIIKRSMNKDEAEYYELIKEILRNKGKIDEKDRRALRYFAERVGLKQEVVIKLEKLAIETSGLRDSGDVGS